MTHGKTRGIAPTDFIHAADGDEPRTKNGGLNVTALFKQFGNLAAPDQAEQALAEVRAYLRDHSIGKRTSHIAIVWAQRFPDGDPAPGGVAPVVLNLESQKAVETAREFATDKVGTMDSPVLDLSVEAALAIDPTQDPMEARLDALFDGAMCLIAHQLMQGVAEMCEAVAVTMVGEIETLKAGGDGMETAAGIMLHHEHIATGPAVFQCSGDHEPGEMDGFARMGEWVGVPKGTNANPMTGMFENLLPTSLYGKGGEA